MASISETGHAKNVANFQTLISFCTAYGTAYNPSKASIKLTALNALLADAQTAMASLTAKKTAYNVAVNARQTAFEPLKPLTTRLLNALSAATANDKILDDAKTIARKIRGERALSKKQTPIAAPAEQPIPTEKNISVSQQSYDQLTEHFAQITAILQAEPAYTPNEADLKIAKLTATLAAIKAANLAVTNAYTDLSNTRITRSNVLYKPDTGICETAQDVKTYIKSVFGSISPQYKQISGLVFTQR